MEFFTSFILVTGAVFIVITAMGMWATGVFGDDVVANIKRQHKRDEKLARERERHLRAMVAARK